jgi:hypothetical protein
MDRRCASTLLFTAFLSAAVLIAVYVVQSQVGLKSRLHGADWASHLAIIDLIMRGENVRAYGAQIGTGIVSPLFAHDIVAGLSSVSGLSTIRVIGMVATLAAIVSLVAAAARSVWVVLAVAESRFARIAGWLVAAATFFVFGVLGLGFYGQIDQANFFFSQTVGTAAALLALSAVQVGMAMEGRPALLSLVSVPILAFMLAGIHLVPALWFATAGAVCALSPARPIRQSLVLSSVVAAVSLLLILSVPSSREVLQLPQAARGVLNLRLPFGLFQLNAHLGLLIGSLVGLAALIAIVALIDERSRLRFRLFNLHAGGIAVLFLGLLTLVGLIANGGTGYYGAAKYAFLFAAEFTLLSGHIAATGLNRFDATPAKPAFVLFAFLLAIVAQQRAAPPDRRDQTLLIDMQRALSKIAPTLPEPAPFPLDDRLSRTERLYLFTSPMGQAKNGRALQLLDPNFDKTLCAAIASLPPSLIPAVVPRWHGEGIDLDKIPTLSPLIFFGSWGDASDDGRPTHAPAAHLAFNIASEIGVLQLCLRLRASPVGAEPSVLTFAINGSPIRTETFEKGNHTQHVALPLSGRGDTVLTILNRSEIPPTPASDRGSVSLKAIWLAPNCGRMDFNFNKSS